MQTFTPLQYMQIDIANLYGKDKLPWNERLAWFEENQDRLSALVPEADKPHQFFAAIDAYSKAIKGEINHHPVGLDATASGLQCLSVLCCDRKAASYCNVLDIGTRADAYTLLYSKFKELVKEDTHITRSDLKQAIMTAFYASEKCPRDIFGEYYGAFCKVMEQECPLIWQIKNKFITDLNPEAYGFDWIMPDNFHVHIDLKDNVEHSFSFMGRDFTFETKEKMPVPGTKCVPADVAHSLDSLILREVTTLAMYNPTQIQRVRDLLQGKKSSSYRNQKNEAMVANLLQRYEETNFLSARILDYLDASTIKKVPEEELKELLEYVPNKPFQVAAIHDCYNVLPNYGNDVRRLYIYNLAKIARSNLLYYLQRAILPSDAAKMQKGDPDMWKDVLNTEYPLS